MLATHDLEYELPEELVATRPAEPRDAARLLVVSRTDRSLLRDLSVRDLPSVLRGGPQADLLVVNASRVLPARFVGVRTDTGGHAEGLYIGPLNLPDRPPAVRWNVLLKMRRMRPGISVALLDRAGNPSGVTLRLIERVGEEGGWLVEVESTELALVPGLGAEDLLEHIGLTPVPPYILAARKRHHVEVDDLEDRERYQTVYAHRPPGDSGANGHTNGPVHAGGSVAAPTAGLHFTPELLRSLETVGVRRAEVTLHVGLGTFKPVESEFVEQHHIHAEWCSVSSATGRAIAEARARGGRVIGVGTTTARTLESFTDDQVATGAEHETSLMITPGHRWRHLDGLMTNFHLPRSTLLAMIASLFSDERSTGVDRVREIYAHAVKERYRFYSYGDAMLILP